MHMAHSRHPERRRPNGVSGKSPDRAGPYLAFGALLLSFALSSASLGAITVAQ